MKSLCTFGLQHTFSFLLLATVGNYHDKQRVRIINFCWSQTLFSEIIKGQWKNPKVMLTYQLAYKNVITAALYDLYSVYIHIFKCSLTFGSHWSSYLYLCFRCLCSYGSYKLYNFLAFSNPSQEKNYFFACFWVNIFHKTISSIYSFHFPYYSLGVYVNYLPMWCKVFILNKLFHENQIYSSSKN